MKGIFIKTKGGLVPHEESEETVGWFNGLAIGQVVSVEAVKPRNWHFLKKYFALLNIAFDHWQQPIIEVNVGGQMVKPKKNYNRFRKDLTILAGHFHTVFRLDGSFRVEADSISFAKMEEEDFNNLYQQTITVLLDKVYGSGFDQEKIDNMVNEYLSFS